MNIRFEWDPQKERVNVNKHGISFDEALTVFTDPSARIFDDEEHSTTEQREIIIENSIKQRLFLVCFTARGASIRIFSARKATKKERKDYKENIGI
ncbi:hypothetical protein AMJ80_01650 [bacterium SM23_31]|nr:MAG: hypothetical protein AMJ80_01650 [bacterium SM23_31]